MQTRRWQPARRCKVSCERLSALRFPGNAPYLLRRTDYWPRELGFFSVRAALKLSGKFAAPFRGPDPEIGALAIYQETAT
jgi:hypothetical protein